MSGSPRGLMIADGGARQFRDPRGTLARGLPGSPVSGRLQRWRSRRSAPGHRPRRRLFVKYLAIIVSLVAVAVLASNLVGLWFTSRETTDEVSNVERTTAAGIRVRLSAVLNDAAQDALTAADSGIRQPTLAERTKQLFQFLGPQFHFTDLDYVDPSGIRRLRVSKDTHPIVSRGPDLSRERIVVRASHGGVAYGRVRLRTWGPQHQLVIPVAVSEAGGGVLIAWLDLEVVRDELSPLAGALPGFFAYVVDDRGVVAAQSDRVLFPDVTTAAGLPQVQRALDGHLSSHAVDGRSLNGGGDVLSYAVRMPAQHWVVFVDRPRDEALAPVSNAINRTIIFLIIALALAVAAAIFLARRMVRPIRTIQDGAARIASGHLDERIEVRSNDELGALAEEFNRMAEQLQSHYATLERRVEHRTRDLRESLDRNEALLRQIEDQNREIEAASRHKSAFLANMSHELRTPLNAIIGFSDVLRERMFGDLTERQAEYLEDIHASGRHLLALINDILDLAKVEAGRGELDLTDVDVRACLEQGVGMVRERALRGAVDLQLDAPGDLGTVRADERRIKQVVLNLLANAVKFTPQLGRVEVVARRREREVEIAVHDTGVGIAPDDQQRIFDEFEQAGDPRGRDGSGLGLALARRFVEVHGGRLTVASEIGRGSTFVVTLPIAGPPGAEAPAQPEAPPRAAPASHAADLVLVVEDDERAAELLTIHLREAGYDVAVASGVDEGIALARRLRPTVVTLDVIMAGRDGWDFIAEAKADPALAAIPIVVVSIVDEPLRGFALGAVDYLVKPVSGPRLIAAVTRAGVAAGRRAPRVLVVDDDPSALTLASVALEPGGFDVALASGGLAALRAVREERPDLVVLDLLMPEVDGFAVLDALRADPATADVPVLVLTSATLSGAEREHLRARVSHLAHKGELDRERFVEIVRGLCAQRVPAP
jgi:signal transduction histidine kinase/CheY-like chemotaxis protein